MPEIEGQCGKISSKFLLKYKYLIQAFEKCPVSAQVTLISNASLDFAKLLCELSINILHNTVSLSKACIKQMTVYKRLLLYFSNRSVSLRTKVKRLKRDKGKNRKFIIKLFKCILRNL